MNNTQLSTNQPSLLPILEPPVPVKLYLQIRICAEHYTGSRHIKHEYQIELPSNAVELDQPTFHLYDWERQGPVAQVVIPVILQEPSSGSPVEVIPIAAISPVI